MLKKKYHGGLLAFFCLLFVFLLGNMSSCFALETGRMNYSQAKYIFDYFLTDTYFQQNIFSFTWDTGSSPDVYGRNTYTKQQIYNLFYNETNINAFVTNFNDLDLQYNNLGVEHYLFYCFADTSNFWIRCIPNNNTIGNDVPHLKIGRYNTYTTNWGTVTNVLFQTSEPSSFDTLNIKYFTDGSIISTSLGVTDTKYVTYKSNGDLFARVPGLSETVYYCLYSLTSLNNAYFYGPSSINNTISDSSYYNTPYILKTFYVPPTPPPVPDDTPTGNITNNSGDVTGNIDLSGIEQGLGNIQNQISGDSQRIIDNQIQNTELIVNAINNSNENYWGSGDTLTGDAQSESIEDNLTGIMTSLSGDLMQNETFVALQTAENGFLDLFRNQQQESVYDLKFEWDDFEYNGVVLIPRGSLNISQLCRDNVQLGYIQGLIRIIFNFEVSITLIYQIWNLILATLGIDNPFLYEDYNGVERINADTGETTTTVYKRKRYYKR